jgi:hypothetical protein
MNPVAADVRRLHLKFLKRGSSLLTSAATVQVFKTRTLRGILIRLRTKAFPGAARELGRLMLPVLGFPI